MAELTHRTCAELVDLMRSGALSPVELMEATLERIEATNGRVNAFVALRGEEALAEARSIAERLAHGDPVGPLAGIPFGVKDLEDVAGMVTSFGSVPFKDHVAQTDSVQVARLKAAGAIVVGKTNTPEFGFTGFTKNRVYGVTRNPWNLERTPGGSSGGAGAAVAAGMVPLATGSDAGGSIRIPASYCGCFGLKPSSGRIPMGPSPMLHMTGTAVYGPLCRSVEDAALYLDAASGYHPADPSSLPHPGLSYREALSDPMPRLRIGYSPTLGYATVQRDVLQRVEEGVEVFRRLGHEVVGWEGVLPDVSEAWSRWMSLEVYAQVFDRFDAIRPELGRSLAASVEDVREMSVDDHVRYQKLRSDLNRVLWDFFEHHDLMLTPTMPTEAFDAKGPPPSEIEGTPIPILWAVAFTYPFNFSGHPAATVRAGLTDAGLPAGLQIVGPRHREDLVLRAAYAYEQERPWNEHWPSL